MEREEIQARSRWMMRVLEWDDSRARYPNIWHAGMPRHILAFERIAGRLRLGDLVAVYHPASSRHAERSERFVGLARVAGLRRSDVPDHAWIDLESAHRFDPPLDLGRAPRRVFMCCDPAWPEQDTALFRRVLDAAAAAGWEPLEAERDADTPPVPGSPGVEPAAVPAQAEEAGLPVAETAGTSTEGDLAAASSRLFGGVEFSADMRDPRETTWLALVAMLDDRLRVVRLDATGRHGLQVSLRHPDRELMRAEAIGLAFPFGLPLAFGEALIGRAAAHEGWWALAKRFEKLTWPEYLVALQAFRDEHGDLRRLTDELHGTASPLQRSDPDLGSRSYHGIRMIAEDRSRFAIRPFESASARLLLEVDPRAAMRRMGVEVAAGPDGPDPARVLEALARLDPLPVEVAPPHRLKCIRSMRAVAAVVAARSAALAVSSGEADRPAEALAPDQADRVRREGWTYGLETP
jgi:hypothetical protein